MICLYDTLDNSAPPRQFRVSIGLKCGRENKATTTPATHTKANRI